MSNLKPCPFCGGSASLVVQENAYDQWYGLISCNECSAYVGDDHYDTEEGAKTVLWHEWNRRTEAASLARESAVGE